MNVESQKKTFGYEKELNRLTFRWKLKNTKTNLLQICSSIWCDS